jgi:membrane protein implicated in regulation of membrane protease activity
LAIYTPILPFLLLAFWPLSLLLAFFINLISLKAATSNRVKIENMKHDEFMGKPAICISDMKPTGRIKLDEQILEAICSDGYIESGTKVVIVGKKGFSFVIQKHPDSI